jgi:hypothetical protein
MIILENLQLHSLADNMRFIQVKKYFDYLLMHQLDMLAGEMIQEMQAANYPPLLEMIGHEKEHLQTAIKNNLLLFFQTILGIQPAAAAGHPDSSQISYLLRTNHLLNAVDITRLYSYNKKILTNYLLTYTKDCDIIIEITLALEDIFRELLAHTLTSYFQDGHTWNADSDSKYREYLTTIQELEESREVLRSYISAFKQKNLFSGAASAVSADTPAQTYKNQSAGSVPADWFLWRIITKFYAPFWKPCRKKPGLLRLQESLFFSTGHTISIPAWMRKKLCCRAGMPYSPKMNCLK